MRNKHDTAAEVAGPADAEAKNDSDLGANLAVVLRSSALANYQKACAGRILETDALTARDFRNSRTVPAELRCKSTALARRMIDQQDMIDGPALAVVKRSSLTASVSSIVVPP